MGNRAKQVHKAGAPELRPASSASENGFVGKAEAATLPGVRGAGRHETISSG